MRKLLFSLAAILVLLVLVSCPDGMIPTSILDIALTVSEDSEIELEQFEKLNYTVKEVESGKEITQEFSTIENIKVPVVTTGEYVISVTGVTEDDNYTYTCSGSETVTVTENQATKVEIVLKTTKVIKEATISLSFDDKIEKSDEYDLSIAKVAYVVTALDKEIAKGESKSNSISLTMTKEVSELNYTLTAYNASGDIVGEGNGILKIEAGVKEYSVSILEKEGEGTIIFDLEKDSRYNFPEIKVGDKIVKIEIGPYGNTGTGSVALKNGVYDIYEDGVIKESVRVVQGKEKTISYDYRKWVNFDFYIDVNQENAKGLNLELDHFHYVVTSLTDSFVHNSTAEKNVIGVGFLEDDYDYLFEAVNSDGVVFAEAKGKVLLSEYEGPVKVVMKEKAGDGKLLVNCIKNRSDVFPVLTVGDKEYRFEESSKTEGSVTITLPNGLHTVVCKGEEQIVRIAVDQTNTIDYDFSNTLMPVEVTDSIPKYDGCDMEVAKVAYTFEKDGEVIKSDNAITFDEFKALTLKKTGKDVWNYEVKAYNSAGAQIGEASGRYLFAYQKDSFEIELKEKIGEGRIKIVLKVSNEEEFPSVTIGGNLVSVEEFAKDGNVYIYSSNRKSGECEVLIDDSVNTVRIVNDMETTLSADYSTGIDVDINNNVSASGDYVIQHNDSNRFEVVLGGVSLGEGISVKWILNGTEQESRESVIKFGELESGSYVLYAYIYEGDKLLDIASKLFTVESISNEEV